MAIALHPSALVHPSAHIGEGSTVGPYAQIEAGVTMGPGCTVGPFCVLHAGVSLGPGVSLDAGVVLGGDPQDLKYRGEATQVRIGAGVRLREYVTVNRGTGVHGETVIGDHTLIMAYSHIAHDCVIGAGTVIANAVQMGGHVRIGVGAVISGMTGIHQFVSIGAGAFIGGGLRVDKDVPPGIKALGNPLRWGGVNVLGWERLGYTRALTPVIEAFYRELRKQGHAAWPELCDKFEAMVSEDESDEKRIYAMNSSIPLMPLSPIFSSLFTDFFNHSRRGLLMRGDAAR
jgi:UDP-N-acetylglucosamine acyltransferase